MGTASRHLATSHASAFASLGYGGADASTRREPGALLSRSRTTVVLLVAVVLIFSVSAAPASSTTTVSKALRFVVVKRTSTNVTLERGSVRLVVGSSVRFVSVHGVPRYRVIKRAKTYWLLMPVVSVGAYGARHDGRADDTAAIARAMSAAVRTAQGVYLPAGTYLAHSITVPSGLAVYGAGMGKTWLKGSFVFRSYSSFTDLKIGDAGPSVRHTNGATTTSFTRCHFRGGGSGSETLLLGGERSLYHITFTDCEIERTCGTGVGLSGGNTMSIYASQGGYVIEDITFEGCHFGVSNGTATGAPRMMVECWTAHDANSHWKNLTFRNCEFEPSNYHTLDFACYGDSGQGDGVLVEGCTFHGAGVPGAWLTENEDWGYAIDLEWPKNVVIRNNHFHRCFNSAINDSNFGQPYNTAWTITGNTFDWDTTEQGIDAYRGIVCLSGANNIITNNTFYDHAGFTSWPTNGCVEFRYSTATGNTVTGNTFYLGTHDPNATNQWNGATGNTISSNSVIRQ